MISNVFAGGIHISAQSPQFQEQRGEFEGTIAGEANNLSGVQIVVGAGGTGTVAVTVYDSATRVANAEVTLNRNGVSFEFGQSDANGIVTFDNVPVGGGYAIRVISRARARAGSSGALTVTQSAVTSVDIGLSVLGVVSGTLVDGETNHEVRCFLDDWPAASPISKPGRSGSTLRGVFESQPPAAVNYAWVSPQKVVSFFDEFAVVHQNLGEM